MNQESKNDREPNLSDLGLDENMTKDPFGKALDGFEHPKEEYAPSWIDRKPASRKTGQGSAGNVISALASFVYPGLGQLVQGRIVVALFFFALATVLWFFLLGWIIHLWAAVDAARYEAN